MKTLTALSAQKGKRIERVSNAPTSVASLDVIATDLGHALPLIRTEKLHRAAGNASQIRKTDGEMENRRKTGRDQRKADMISINRMTEPSFLPINTARVRLP